MLAMKLPVVGPKPLSDSVIVNVFPAPADVAIIFNSMSGLVADPKRGLLSPATTTTLQAVSRDVEILPDPPVSVTGPTVVVPSETVITGSA